MPEDKPYKLTNFTITKLFRHEDPDGKWVRFDIYTDHPKAEDRKFAYFPDTDKPESWPIENARVQEMEFTIKQSGKYTNYNVKKILYKQKDQDVKKKPENGNEFPGAAEIRIGKEPSVCASYVTDLTVALINAGNTVAQIEEDLLPQCVGMVARQGALLYKDLQKELNRVGE